MAESTESNNNEPKSFWVYPQKFNKDNVLSYVQNNLINIDAEDKRPIYGLPWDLFPSLAKDGPNSEHQKEIRERIENSTVNISYDADTDTFQEQYAFLKESAILKGIIEFLTSAQWDYRKNVQNGLSKKMLRMYTNLITDDNKSNLQLQIRNSAQYDKRKTIQNYLSDAFENTAIGNVFKSLDGGQEVGADIFSKAFANADVDKTVANTYGKWVQFKNSMKMLSRENIALWDAGDMDMTTTFSFIFRQHSIGTLQEMYVPVLSLLLFQSPYQNYLGYGKDKEGNDVKNVSYTITEKVPPLDISISLGNGAFQIDHQIIENLKIELFDVKDVIDDQTGEKQLPELGIESGQIPTQASVFMQVKSIIPIQTFFHYVQRQGQEQSSLSSLKSINNQLPKQTLNNQLL